MSLDAWKETPLQHHQNALKQYTTAIKEMRQAAFTRKQDLRTTLLTCLVIMCFEAWNGNQDLAIRQIQTGFRLIQAWREEEVDERDERRFVGLESSLTDTVEDELVRVFKRLDVQVCLVLISFCVATSSLVWKNAIASRCIWSFGAWSLPSSYIE